MWLLIKVMYVCLQNVLEVDSHKVISIWAFVFMSKSQSMKELVLNGTSLDEKTMLSSTHKHKDINIILCLIS